MIESIHEHDLLVDELVKKTVKDYDEAKSKLSKYITGINIDNDHIITTLAIKTSVLSWIKEEIIDNNGTMFRRYSEANINDKTAIFYIDNIDLKVLISSDDNICDIVESRLYNYIDFESTSEFDVIYKLCTLNERNLRFILVSDIDRVIYKKEHNIK